MVVNLAKQEYLLVIGAATRTTCSSKEEQVVLTVIFISQGLTSSGITSS